jgi:hypothetical protein
MADGIGRAAALIEAVLRRTGLNSRHINFPESEMLQAFPARYPDDQSRNDDNSGSIIAVRVII